MLIQEWMSRDVLTIKSNNTIADAIKLFESRVISLLPVVREEQLVGVVTDGDIKRASPSDATGLDKYEITSILNDIKVDRIMSQPVVTIKKNRIVSEAAQLMLTKGISGLPIVDRRGRLEGILTKSDVFRCFVTFTGVTGNSQILGFSLNDKPGVIKRITDKIRHSGGRLGSVLTSYDKIITGRRIVFIVAFGLSSENYDLLTREYRNKGKLLFGADLTRGYRELYL